MNSTTNTTATASFSDALAEAHTIGELATVLLRAMSREQREDGTEFYKFHESVKPYDGWVSDMCQEVYGDMFPDDFKNEFINDALEIIADNWEEGTDSYDLFEHLESDIYNADLLRWVSSDLTRAEYVNDGISEYGWSADGGLYNALGVGQLKEKEEVLQSIFESLSSRAEEIEDEDNGDDEEPTYYDGTHRGQMQGAG